MALDDQLERWCDREASRHVAALSELIAVPSVSADPDRRADVAACCDRLVAMMAQVATLGFLPIVVRRLLCFVLFWHALDIVWIGVFTIVYLGAH